MSWSDAAWIGPTVVAVVASAVTYGTHRHNLTAEQKRWKLERGASIKDRRLDTMRDGYLSLMSAAGGLSVAVKDHAFVTTSPRYVAEWFTRLTEALRASGGVVDAYGSADTRNAIAEVRELVSAAVMSDQALVKMKDVAENPEKYKPDAMTSLAQSVTAELQVASDKWTPALSALLDSMREDLAVVEQPEA